MRRDHIETTYRPISCASYDQLEIAILHRRRLRLVWNEDNVIYDQVVTPLNLRTAQGQEFLTLRLADGDTRDVRLDHIRRAETL
jgi:transcriptional antiterminator Rof (Rho-off)